MKEPSPATLSSTWEGDADAVGLRWLLARPELGLSAVHLPPGDPALSWAHAIELEDPTPWMHGHGMVLTTGMRLPRSRPGQAAYVARLTDAGARALGFGVGFRFTRVPPALVEACRDQGLPLVGVPLPTPFLAIVQAVSERLGELRRLRLQESLATQRVLTRAALRGGTAAVVRSLARALDAGVLVLDADLEEVARAGSPALATVDVTAETRGHGGRAVSVSRPGAALEIQPLGGRPAEPSGWLAVRRSAPPTATDRLVLSHAVSVITLELARDTPPAATGPVEAALVQALTSPGSGDLTGLLSGLGFPDGERTVPVGLRADRSEDLARAVARLRSTTPVLAADWEWGGSRGLLLVVPESATEQPTGARTALAPGRPGAEGVAVGVGLPTAPGRLAESLPSVGRALAVAGPGETVHALDLPVERALAEPALGRALAASAGRWLEDLRAYDAAHGTDLVASLRAFLLHHGVLDPAARDLGVHRHTLRNRMGRVEQVTGCDLGDPTHRALVVLALPR